METATTLQKQFKKEKGISWQNKQGEPDIDYVNWLEEKLIQKNEIKEQKPVVGSDLSNFECVAGRSFSTCHIHENSLEGCLGCGNFKKTV